jgi:hypothetical protein
VGFGLALAVASVATVDKYLGLGAACIYVLALALATPVLLDVLGLVRVHLTERQALLLARAHGTRAAATVAALATTSFAAVTLPFYVGHEDEFTPIAASDKLEGFDGAIPGGARAVLVGGLCVSVALALVYASVEIRAVFAQTAVVQAFFLVAVVALASADGATVELEPLVPGYGLPVLMLALGALAVPPRRPSWAHG